MAFLGPLDDRVCGQPYLPWFPVCSTLERKALKIQSFVRLSMAAGLVGYKFCDRSWTRLGKLVFQGLLRTTQLNFWQFDVDECIE